MDYPWHPKLYNMLQESWTLPLCIDSLVTGADDRARHLSYRILVVAVDDEDNSHAMSESVCQFIQTLLIEGKTLNIPLPIGDAAQVGHHAITIHLGLKKELRTVIFDLRGTERDDAEITSYVKIVKDGGFSHELGHTDFKAQHVVVFMPLTKLDSILSHKQPIISPTQLECYRISRKGDLVPYEKLTHPLSVDGQFLYAWQEDVYEKVHEPEGKIVIVALDDEDDTHRPPRVTNFHVTLDGMQGEGVLFQAFSIGNDKPWPVEKCVYLHDDYGNKSLKVVVVSLRSEENSQSATQIIVGLAKIRETLETWKDTFPLPANILVLIPLSKLKSILAYRPSFAADAECYTISLDGELIPYKNSS